MSNINLKPSSTNKEMLVPVGPSCRLTNPNLETVSLNIKSKSKCIVLLIVTNIKELNSFFAIYYPNCLTKISRVSWILKRVSSYKHNIKSHPTGPNICNLPKNKQSDKTMILLHMAISTHCLMNCEFQAMFAV